MQFWYVSRFVYGVSPEIRAGLETEILQAFKARDVDKGEQLVNSYFSCLATNQKYGLCKPLRLVKKISLRQASLPQSLFSVLIYRESILYEGNFSELSKFWPMSRLLAYHHYFQVNNFNHECFKVHIGDCCDIEAPVLIACSNHSNHTLIPDPEFLGSRGYQALAKYLERSFVSFSRRKNTLFWRGGVNCNEQYAYPWRNNPRLICCQFVRDLKVNMKVDVKAVDIDYIYKRREDQSEINALGITGKPCKIHLFQRYKYHLDIDGYSCAWAGFFTKLLMGCVVFKVESLFSYKQWYYDDLMPFEHYIPISCNLGDLEEKIGWALKNEDECLKISSRARKLALSTINDCFP